jgi:uncharacterized protein YcbX
MSSAIGTLTEMWRYPVKSLGGERVERADCFERGIAGDRRWAVRGADGKLGSGKTTRRFRRMPGLLGLAARLGTDGTALIRFPDGTGLPATGADSEARLSAVVGEPVTVVEETEVSHFDDSPLHLVTTASLDQLAIEADPTNKWGDRRRFRPNLVFDCGNEPGAENGWMGRHLRMGQVLIEVVRPTERCAMVTLGQEELPLAPHLLSYLTATRKASLGVYARVLSPGTIAVGDGLFEENCL